MIPNNHNTNGTGSVNLPPPGMYLSAGGGHQQSPGLTGSQNPINMPPPFYQPNCLPQQFNNNVSVTFFRLSKKTYYFVIIVAKIYETKQQLSLLLLILKSYFYVKLTCDVLI